MTSPLPIPQEQPGDEPLTPESLWDHLRLTEYKIARVFNKDFFNAEDLGATKPDLRRDIDSSIKTARQVISDDAEQKKAVEYASKLLALLSVHDFIRDDNKTGLNEFFDHVTVCGWDILKNEAWAPELVEKAAGCSRFQAIKAIEETPSGDLSEAIQKAPSMRAQPPVATGKPPTKEAIATMRREKNKKKKNN